MPETPLLNETPPDLRRTWIAIGVAIFLLTQICIPISYYLRDEPTSERFAWRMFSSIDLSSWNSEVTVLVDENGTVVERQVPLSATLQETYVKAIEQANLDIVESFMRRLSEQPGLKEVRFEARGTLPSGKEMVPIRMSMKPGEPLEKL